MEEHPFDSRRGRLYRGRKDRMVAGVCGGLAQYFNVDPVLIRLGFVVLTLTTGLGIPIYLVMTLVVPNRPSEDMEPLVTGAPLDSRRGREVAGYGLAGLGLVILAGNLGLYRFINWDIFWPGVLIAIGVMLLVKRSAE